MSKPIFANQYCTHVATLFENRFYVKRAKKTKEEKHLQEAATDKIMSREDATDVHYSTISLKVIENVAKDC